MTDPASTTSTSTQTSTRVTRQHTTDKLTYRFGLRTSEPATGRTATATAPRRPAGTTSRRA
ncbi:hypothetical protein [Plantibacter sp. YIM 135347]|uniref:hypothetical protein n=1 Tax=Plantibacter sp. YIM 135347 TaxID=3423919 RepID=UPI003D357F83